MTSAQTAFAALAAVFTVAGAVLIDRGNAPVAAWVLLVFALAAFILLGWMIISSAMSRK